MATDLRVTVDKGSAAAQAARFEPFEARFEKALKAFYTALIGV